MLNIDTSKHKKVELLEGASFTPLIDGSFVMKTDDDSEEVHVPRQLALRQYPILGAAHDVIFGKNKWGAVLPLTVDTAPVGTTHVIAEMLLSKSFDDLVNFFIVLIELGTVLDGTDEHARETEERAKYVRIEGMELCRTLIADADDKEQAMRFCVAAELQKVREALCAGFVLHSDRVRNLCAISALPM